MSVIWDPVTDKIYTFLKAHGEQHLAREALDSTSEPASSLILPRQDLLIEDPTRVRSRLQ